MKRSFPRELYGRRRQCESLFSRLQRRLPSSLASRRWDSQVQEVLLMVLTYDLTIVLFCHISTPHYPTKGFYRASSHCKWCKIYENNLSPHAQTDILVSGSASLLIPKYPANWVA